MPTDRTSSDGTSPFLRYLASRPEQEARLPSLAVLSDELGISLAALREQLEVARALGLVEVRPKTGVKKLPYTFQPAVQQSLTYAVSMDMRYFQRFAEVRNHLESSYWFQAVPLLTSDDVSGLVGLVEQAEEKLNRLNPQVPHQEHRQLHLAIYQRLDNPFMTGLLEAYWDTYEALGLVLVNEVSYLRTVWAYHRRMVEAIRLGDLQRGYQALLEHTDLLYKRPQPISRQKFE